MADREVKIEVKTVSDTKGIDKATKALEQLSKEEKRLEKARSQFLTAQQAEVAEINRLAESAKRARPPLDGLRDAYLSSSKALAPQAPQLKSLNKGVKDLKLNADPATKSTRNLGLAGLEASRAFEDMQYGIRGALNNIPGLVMMLGGTAGIAGAASAAAVAVSILAPRIKDFLGDADDTKGLEKFNELLNETANRIGKIAAKKAEAAQQEWLDSLDDEEEAMNRTNDLLRDNISLLEAQRLAKLSIAEADREKRKAEIDANKDMSEAEKIRAKALLDEQALAEKGKEEFAKIQQRLDEKEITVKEKELAEKSARADIEMVTASKEGLQKAEKSLQGEIAREEQKTKLIPKLEQQAKEEREAYEGALEAGGPGGGVPIEVREELRKKAEKSAQRLQDAQNAEARKVRITADLEKTQAALGVTVTDEQRLKEEIQSRSVATEQARRDARVSAQIAEEQRGAVEQSIYSQRDTLRIKTGGQATAAEEAAAKAKAAEEAKAERERVKAELEAKQSGLEGTTEANRERIRGSGRSELTGIAESIGRADTSDEIRVLGDRLKDQSGKLGTATIQALQKMLAEQQKQAKAVEDLKSRLDNLP